MEVVEGGGDLLRDLRIGFEEIVSVAFGRARTDAREFSEGFNSGLEGCGEHGYMPRLPRRPMKGFIFSAAIS